MADGRHIESFLDITQPDFSEVLPVETILKWWYNSFQHGDCPPSWIIAP